MMPGAKLAECNETPTSPALQEELVKLLPALMDMDDHEFPATGADTDKEHQDLDLPINKDIFLGLN